MRKPGDPDSFVDPHQVWGYHVMDVEAPLPSHDSIQAALRDARHLAPDMDRALDLYQEVFRIQCSFRDRFTPPATRPFAEGGGAPEPLLMRPLPGLSDDLLREVISEFGRVFMNSRADQRDCATELLEAAGTREGSLVELVEAALDGGDALASRAASLRLSPPILRSLLSLAASPAYEASASAALHAGMPVRGRLKSCPCCGQPPAIALIRAQGEGRWLECSLCRTQWRVSRLSCSFCESQDASKLGSLVSTTFAFHSVEFCEKCRRFIKTVDCNDLSRTICPRVEQVMMLPLDVAAVEQGYRP